MGFLPLPELLLGKAFQEWTPENHKSYGARHRYCGDSFYNLETHLDHLTRQDEYLNRRLSQCERDTTHINNVLNQFVMDTCITWVMVIVVFIMCRY
jgi:hypothetical protein